MLYTWQKKEEHLGSGTFTARKLVIETLTEDERGRLLATGFMEVMDYTEGCAGSDLWKAVGNTCPHGVTAWNVAPTEGFWIDSTGQAMFTLVNEYNVAIRAFVSAGINHFLKLREGGMSTPIMDVLVPYNGPRATYTGGCICERIKTTSDMHPFPWRRLTDGGQFPEHCFKCSCGGMWWEVDMEGGSKGWVPVIDTAAWEMLLNGNGEATAPIGFVSNGVELMETIRRRGINPIG